MELTDQFKQLADIHEQVTSRLVNQCWAKFEFLAKNLQKSVIFNVFWSIFENFEH